MTYDFIDIGSSHGGSVKYAAAHYGTTSGPTGYGIDIDDRKVQSARDAGIDVRLGRAEDITDKARWVTCMHVLEHLPGKAAARAMIETMVNIATEGVYITFPYFDSDTYLTTRDQPLKLFWSDWTGHTYHPSTLEMFCIFRDLQLTVEHELYGHIGHSQHQFILPLSAPANSLHYDPSMGPKQDISLFNVFQEHRYTIHL